MEKLENIPIYTEICKNLQKQIKIEKNEKILKNIGILRIIGYCMNF